MHRLATFSAIILLGTPFAFRSTPDPAIHDLPKVEWNDNVETAGSLDDGILDVHLEATKSRWHILGDEQPGVEVLAFAELGKAPSIPGPMIRVREGTTVRAMIHNTLDSTLLVHGLSPRRGERMDTLVVPAGEARTAEFVADAEGTYYYWGGTTGQPVGKRFGEDSQLLGALVVDPAEGPVAADRVMVIGIWAGGEPQANGEPDFTKEFLVINGRPWPHTERLTYAMGDSIRWRLINGSWDLHPMHLHGFYYRVDARGDFAKDTVYWRTQRRMAVTERMEPGTTMSMVWSPDRPGGWIFHCHISWHVVTNNSLDGVERTDEEVFGPMLNHGHIGDDPQKHVENVMGGLMMAMYVEPPEGYEIREPKRREMRLFIQSDSLGDTPSATGRHYSYVLQEGSEEPAPDSVRLPGSTLILRKGEPTSVWVINRTNEPSQVHWHGLEIESYFDGVTGVGGYPNRLTPAILPHDSFEMRITPPRAGSFMYHTHVNDIRQQSSGLYGAFIVLEEDEAWEPERDRVFLIGNTPFDPTLGPALNGEQQPDPIELSTGVTYRFRFMNITLDGSSMQALLTWNGYPTRWRPIAKDGFDLRPDQRNMVEAQQTVAVGETFDMEYLASAPRKLKLEIRGGAGQLLIEQAIKVVAAAAADGSGSN